MFNQNNRKSNIHKLLQDNTTNEPETTKSVKVSMDKQLSGLVSKLKLFKDKNDVTYIEIIDYDDAFQEIDKRIVRIKSDAFREYIISSYNQNYFRFAQKNSLESLIMQLVYRAKIQGTLIEVFNRIGIDSAGNIYIDLADNSHMSVMVNTTGWYISRYPIIFSRYPHNAPLPVPQVGGNLKEILNFIPVESEQEQCLLLCWLVSSMVPDIERCFLLLEGMPGTAKSTVAKRLKALIDPMKGTALVLSNKDHEVAQQLGQHCMPYYDNITTIPRNISDIFCSCFSNTAYSKKALYTDDGSFIFNMSGNLIISTLKLERPRPDFLERCYKVEFQKLQNYKSQKRLETEFDLILPKLFGALLDTLVKVLNMIKNIPEPDKYRSVDFDHHCAATAEVLGYGQEFFWMARDYVETIKAEDIIDSVPMIKALHSFLSHIGGYWKGCMQELIPHLKAFTDHPDFIPKLPISLSKALKKSFVELQAAGITVTPMYPGRCQLYEITLNGRQSNPIWASGNKPFVPGNNSAVSEIIDQMISDGDIRGSSSPEITDEQVFETWPPPETATGEVDGSNNSDPSSGNEPVSPVSGTTPQDEVLELNNVKGSVTGELEHVNPFLVDDPNPVR